jgi:hypothetical protein
MKIKIPASPSSNYSSPFLISYNRVENLSPAMVRGIDSRSRVLNLVAKLHWLAGRYDNPMPTWFLVPISGLKLPTPIATYTLYFRGSKSTFNSPMQCLAIFSVFLNLLRSPGIDFQPGGRYDNPFCRTRPACYMGWLNRFLGIDSWAPYTFTNTGSDINSGSLFLRSYLRFFLTLVTQWALHLIIHALSSHTEPKFVNI